jgi:hypothetical protein
MQRYSSSGPNMASVGTRTKRNVSLLVVSSPNVVSVPAVRSTPLGEGQLIRTEVNVTYWPLLTSGFLGP